MSNIEKNHSQGMDNHRLISVYFRLVEGVISLAVILGFIFLSTGTLAAQDSNISYGVDFASRYIWRGWDLTPNDNPAAQPSVTYSSGAFEFGYWGSLALSERDLIGGLDEHDLWFGYSGAIGEINYSAGLTLYSWLNADGGSFGDNSTYEPYVSLSKNGVPYDPSLTIFYDIDDGDGLYVLLAAGRSVEVGANGIDLGASVGYNGGQWGAESGISDIVLSAGTSFTLDFGTISPSLNFALIPEESVNTDNEYWFAVSLGR